MIRLNPMRKILESWSGALRSAVLLPLVVATVLIPVGAQAQVSGYGDKVEGTSHGDELPTVLQRVQVTQHLNAQLPTSAPFVDESGHPVTLGTYLDGQHPAVLALVYYNCPMLCSEEMDGLTSALEMVRLRPGKDFQIVVVSIDPAEGPQLAAKNKSFYVKRYGHPETADGWHFLTGPKSSIDQLTGTVGFGYVKVPGPDGRLTQFAHASSIELLTPEGRLAQYYLGVEYSPKDILLGLIDASGNKIGSPVANILTYCYHYDPQTNKHSLIVARVVQLGGMLTVAALASFLFVMFRRDLSSNGDQVSTHGRDGRRTA